MTTGSMDQALGHVLGELSDRQLRMYPQSVRECLDQLTDDQIWWRPNASSNSIGNLVLHLSGNLNHYLGRGVVGTGYRRDRPAEFSEEGPLPREELVRRFEDAIAVARRTFEAATPARLLETADLGPESAPVASVLARVSIHFSAHVGQIIYVTKMLRDGVFREELWLKVRDR